MRRELSIAHLRASCIVHRASAILLGAVPLRVDFALFAVQDCHPQLGVLLAPRLLFFLGAAAFLWTAP